jgi:multidrug efflux pump subunit AcrA (membrane-fusion protein)
VEKKQAIFIPASAVQFDQGGRYVLVVNDENVVQQKRIKVGNQVGEMWVIEEGLTEKDRVITLGVLRAHPGSKVNPTTGSQTSPKPGPTDSGKTPEK